MLCLQFQSRISMVVNSGYAARVGEWGESPRAVRMDLAIENTFMTRKCIEKTVGVSCAKRRT